MEKTTGYACVDIIMNENMFVFILQTILYDRCLHVIFTVLGLIRNLETV